MAKDDRAYIGIDLGGTNIQVGVLDAKDQVVVRTKAKTKAENGTEGVIKRIGDAVHEAMIEARLHPEDVGGAGIGAPGAINIEKGIVLNAPNLRWSKFPLAQVLEDELKVPVTVDNDVNVGTWGEYQAGSGRGFDDLLGVFVGTGIGGGLVLGGKLYYGHYLTAGEIGHTILHADAPLGRRTLENCASRTAIVNLLSQLVLANHKSELTKITGGDLSGIRSKAIAEALEEEDELTTQVVQRAARYVGAAIANVVTMMSLPCVVLGGGLTGALGKPWVQWVRSSFEEFVFPEELRACEVRAGKLEDDAGIVGAALLARQRLGGNGKGKKN